MICYFFHAGIGRAFWASGFEGELIALTNNESQFPSISTGNVALCVGDNYDDVYNMAAQTLIDRNNSN